MTNAGAWKDVTLSVAHHVARITIDREAKRNALSLEVIDGLVAALRAAEAAPAARVAVLSGAGTRSFAAGADLDELPELLATPDAARAYDARVARLYEAMESSRLPVVARLAGSAIGGGALLALACDLRVAAPTVTMGFPAARIGLMLSPHEYRLLLDHLSPARAKFLVLTGRRLRAEEAADWGLIDVVAGDGTLDDAVDRLAQEIADGAPLTIAASKSLIRALSRADADLEAAAARAYDGVYSSADFAVGLAAVRAKAVPRFSGR